MSGDGLPTGAPRPGDPASRGPRPNASWRDAAWLVLAVSLTVITGSQLVRLAVRLVTDPDVHVTGGGALLGFLITVVWFLVIYWLVAGAWRRSVWGCPFDHTEDALWERRCPRHDLLPARGGIDPTQPR